MSEDTTARIGPPTPEGSTTMAETVVATIAGIAALEVPGVFALGSGATRAVGALHAHLPGASRESPPGVVAAVGETQAAVDLVLVAEYGTRIVDVAAGVRHNVAAAVLRMTDLRVTEVNVTVRDLHLPPVAPPEPSDVGGPGLSERSV